MKNLSVPTLAEDLMLVLFQPDSGTIAGENSLCSVLAGAVLAELAFNERVTTTATRTGSVRVGALEARAPSDEILRSAWDYVSISPGVVQNIVVAIGPTLRQPLLERLVARGDLREENGKVLGMLKITTLKDGGSGRRFGLIRDVRDALVDGAEPTPRVAALAALVWGSGTLQKFDPEIPWSSVVNTRARDLGRGNWSAEGAPLAFTPATDAMIEVIAATLAHPGPG